MKYYYDLHIHSVLSPCADDLMTPNNIVNMANLSELDIIAITDHNSCLNHPAFEALQSSYDLLIVYGCELNVEDAHIVVYFRSVNESAKFQKYLETIINNAPYDEVFYGEELIMDEYDMVVDKLDYSLIECLNIKFDDLLVKLQEFDVVVGCAHLDKAKNSARNLINEDNAKYIDVLEVTDFSSLGEIYNEHPYLRNKFCMTNSDSHQIVALNEAINSIELDELSIDKLFEVMKNE